MQFSESLSGALGAECDQAQQLLQRAQDALASQHWVEAQTDADAVEQCLERKRAAQGQLKPSELWWLGQAAQLQAEAAWARGDFAQTFACASRAAERYAGLLRRREQVQMLALTSVAACSAGLPDEGLPFAVQALDAVTGHAELFDELPAALGAVAHVHANLGEYAEAEWLYLQALSRAREGQLGQAVVRVYANALMAGSMAFDELTAQGQHELAHALSQRQLALAFQARRHLDESFMNKVQRAVLRLNIGHAMMNADRLKEAGELIQQANELLADPEYATMRYSARHAWVEWLIRRFELDEAKTAMQQLLDEQAAGGLNLFLREMVLRSAVKLHEACDDAAQAQHYQQLLQEAQDAQAAVRHQAAAEIMAARRTIDRALPPPA